MHSLALLLLLPLTATAAATETVLGVYIFHRHGDRTAKAWPPTNLTALGADEVSSSGAFYRNRYVSSSASSPIKGLSTDIAAANQLAFSAPVDTVLQDSAMAFLQGVYPPIARVAETLRNGTKVEGPLSGYQYVPVNAVAGAATEANAESDAWLQGDSGCPNGVISSNNFLASQLYQTTYSQSKSFYQDLMPMYNTTFNSSEANFKNAYSIFDYINVANIHNATIPSSNLLTNSSFNELFNLANIHEWNLSFNQSDPVRAISGSVLAGQIVQAFDALAGVGSSSSSSGKPTFNVQFGAYGTFMSFFGLAQMQSLSPDFVGICNYASSMTFELVTNSTSATPSADELSVRFYFANGTTAQNPLNIYPLFGQKQTTLSYNDFRNGMLDFAVANTTQWCHLCGSTTGQCAANSTSGGSGSSSSSSSSSSHSGNGVSKPVAGVIGALVTLVVILGAEAAVMGLGGLRLVKKSTLAASSAAQASTTGVKA